MGNNYSYGGLYPGVGHTGDSWVDLNAGYVHQLLTDTYVEGVTYEVSAWVWTNAAEQRLQFYFTTGSTDGLTGNTEMVNMGDFLMDEDRSWQQYTSTFQVPAGWGGQQIGLAIYGRDGTYADDVALTIIPEPVTIGLLGLGALLVRKKKRC